MKRAFTLVELLVVIAVVCLLVSVLVTAAAKARIAALSAVCQARVRDLTSCVVTTCDQRRELVPPSGGLFEDQFDLTHKAWTCPQQGQGVWSAVQQRYIEVPSYRYLADDYALSAPSATQWRRPQSPRQAYAEMERFPTRRIIVEENGTPHGGGWAGLWDRSVISLNP